MIVKEPEDDAALWARMRNGDPEALGDLYERHARDLTSFCIWRCGDVSTAEDVVSSVFLEVWRRRASLTVDDGTARPLLLGIALNMLRNLWRSRRRRDAALQRLRSQQAFTSDPAEDTVERLDARTRVAAMQRRLVDLPRNEQDVLALIAWADLTYEEAARVLGVPIGTVRSRLSRARKRLGDDVAVGDLVTPRPTPLTPTGEARR
jgi:RNA polymerase sigma factor (sigma-70 family)